MKHMLYGVMLAALFSSCSFNNSKMRKLEATNDSLVAVTTQSKEEFNELLATLNSVEDGFQQIKDAENYLTVQAQSGQDLTVSARKRLENDMKMIQQTLQANREKIAQLEKQYKNSNYRSSQLEQTLSRLSREVDEKTKMIGVLQEELSRKDVRIAQLSDSLTVMSSTVDDLSSKTTAQEKVLAEQDAKINTAFYVFGTKSELREEKILEGGGFLKSKKILRSDFNKDYFTKVDVRNFSQLPLFTNDAEVLSNMPRESYDFVRDANDNITLVITDREAFWSLTKYLVILVD